MNKDFETWALGFSGCDGGDTGSHAERATWVCGIEWGGGHDPEGLSRSIAEDVNTPPKGYDSWKDNLEYIFNWQVMKLLSAIEGGSVNDYKAFAELKKPFTVGSNRYFKMNLYPIGFKNTSPDRWLAGFSDITGFDTKDEYVSWCKANRLPKIRSWVAEYRPELVICLGKTYVNDFSRAFYDDNLSLAMEVVDNKDMSWGVNKDGVLVVVLPFMVNRNGLTKNSSIQLVGERISKLLEVNRTKLSN